MLANIIDTLSNSSALWAAKLRKECFSCFKLCGNPTFVANSDHSLLYHLAEVLCGGLCFFNNVLVPILQGQLVGSFVSAEFVPASDTKIKRWQTKIKRAFEGTVWGDDIDAALWMLSALDGFFMAPGKKNADLQTLLVTAQTQGLFPNITQQDIKSSDRVTSVGDLTSKLLWKVIPACDQHIAFTKLIFTLLGPLEAVNSTAAANVTGAPELPSASTTAPAADGHPSVAAASPVAQIVLAAKAQGPTASTLPAAQGGGGGNPSRIVKLNLPRRAASTGGDSDSAQPLLLLFPLKRSQ